ncbi:MAG: L-glutamate gamma-semialdehyde dehydrogenase [Gemmatimonadetes bacterium]|nr:MAG: L-glutamate gamma-semialdehyde dehydrogenase [Gemmatimonadota bacterium]
MYGRSRVPAPTNEPIRPYAPGDPERDALKARLAELAADQIEIPLIIGGEEVRTGDLGEEIVPHRHSHVLARWHRAGPAEVQRAIEAAREAHHTWSRMRWEDRAAIFLKAADLITHTGWRDTLNASTMLGQSKTAFQAEIDAACELADFFRFNVHFAERIYEDQPLSAPGVWNRMEYRPLEGFVYAISPFNFTSIGGNLAGAPALMGTTVVWKPSDHAVFSNYFVYKLLEEAGLPPGVVNFVPGDPVQVTDAVLSSPDFGGLHFTGSTAVFKRLWGMVGERMETFRSYPRLVGETGGKDFIFAHPSAGVDALRTAIVRGAFEYQGQKCSAASRAYIPESVWARLEQPLVDETAAIAMGDPADFRNFMSAVIHRGAFDKIKGYIERARADADAEILVGGECDDSEGFFVRPTIIRTTRPDYVTMCEEIFGPVITVYVYPDADWEAMLDVLDGTSPYGLTGAVFSQDRAAARVVTERLRYAAGNFYVNDKPTGAVVGQQPFGGSRASGTNDKAGSALNLLRWVSPRTIKETFVPPTDYRYPFMGAE